MEPQNTGESTREQVATELLLLGFEEQLVTEALKHTLDKEKAVEIILLYGEKGIDCDVTPILGESNLLKATFPKFQDNQFRYKMIFVVNGDLKMGKGKICAQVAHACLAAYLQMESVALFDQEAKLTLDSWDNLGCAKIVVRAENEKELLELEKKAAALKINTYIVEDAGRTQIKQGSRTVLAIGPVASTVVDPLTSHLKLL